MRGVTKKRVLCLAIPNWPVQRLVVDQPELKRKRIILYVTRPARGQFVAAASPLATRDGIAIDMPLAEAKSLARRSRNRHEPLHLLAHDRAADLQALRQLALACEVFSPIVGLETADQPGCLLMEVTGLGHLFGDEHQLANRVVEHFRKQGYVTHTAIADTIGLAWAVARYSDRPTVLPAGDSTTLGQLPIEALRLQDSTVDTLGQLGVQLVWQLSNLPRASLTARFGDEINRQIDLASGTIEEVIDSISRPADFRARQWLDFPTSHRSTVEVILDRLIKNICDQMRARQQGALAWDIRLVRQSGLPVRFRVNLFQPTATLEHVSQLVQMQLDDAWKEIAARPAKGTSNKTALAKRKPSKIKPFKEPPPEKNEPRIKFHKSDQGEHNLVSGVEVAVTSCVLLAENQRRLFGENPRLDRQTLSHLINRLSSRIGQQNVVYPSLQAGAQPEYACQFRPLVDPGRQRRTGALPKARGAMARPIRLLNPPAPLEAIAIDSVSTASDGLPAMLIDGNRRHRVTQRWGPERIETGWWRGRTVCRDYWRVQTDSQQQLWVYRDLRSSQWFLHGEF